MSLNIIKKIVYQKENSQLIPSKPRNQLQELRLFGLYEFLVFLRIILTLNLQTGWIHEDEFVNSVEPYAGEHFDLQVLKNEAYNSTHPTRTTLFLHFTHGLSYLFAHHFLYTEVYKEYVPNVKALLLVPRIFNLLLSFAVDFLLVKFCKMNCIFIEKKRRKKVDIKKSDKENLDKVNSEGEDEKEIKIDNAFGDNSIRLVTLASSQILLTFTNRSHSANISLILFALLVYLVSESLHKMEVYIPLINLHHRTKDPVEKTRILKKCKETGYTPIEKLHWITLIIVLGLYNDADFLVPYGLIPLFFYLQRGLACRQIGMLHFHARIYTFILYFVLMVIPFVIFDSIYYGHLTREGWEKMTLTIDSFVFSPVNYFASEATSFSSSRDTAIGFFKTILNFFLIFNILGVIALISFFKEFYDVLFIDWKYKPKMDSQWTFLNCIIFLPLLIICFQSQSTLFNLVPLLFPLVFMHGHKIPLVSRFNAKIGFLWFFFNFIGVLFWGYLNQGGIVSSFLELYNQLLPIRFNSTEVNIFFSQLSSIPPAFLLAIPNHFKTFIKVQDLDENENFKVFKTVLAVEKRSKLRLYHTGSFPLPLPNLERELLRLIQKEEVDDFISKKKRKSFNLSNLNKVNFILIPTSQAIKSEKIFKRIRLKHVKTYWNHIYSNFYPVGELEEKRGGGGGGTIVTEDFNSEDFLNSNSADRREGILQRINLNKYLDIGFGLYRIEKIPVLETKENNNLTEKSVEDEIFEKTFNFEEPFSNWFTLTINTLGFIFTSFIFVSSYLVFLT